MFRLNHFLLPLTLAGLSACSELTAPLSTTAVRQHNTLLAGCDVDQDTCPFLSDAPGSYALLLTSFDVGTLTLSGVGVHGRAFSAQLTTATLFRRANLTILPPNPVIPNDPTLPPNPIFPTDPAFPTDALQAYDDAIALGLGDGGAIYSAIAGLAAAHVPARVWLDAQTGLVRVFRPIN